MVKVKKEGIILKPTGLVFENLSVLNPGIYQDNDYVHVFYRALDQDHISCIGYARLKGPLDIMERWKEPYLKPKYKYERRGIEDPRIVKINDTFYMTYVVHDGANALIAYSFGKDLFNLKRGGIISPQMSYDIAGKLFEYSKLNDKYYFFKSYYIDNVHRSVKIWDKDGLLFPEKINDKFAFVHRILPGVQVAYIQNLNRLKDKQFWIEHIKNLSRHVILEGAHGFEARNVGGGCPPIRTPHGWLLIYHGVEPLNKGRVYHAAAALLDLKDPTRVIARLPYPLFSPDEDWEIEGCVPKVVFPTGTAIFDEHLYIYYGAADKYIAVASVHLDSLLKELLKNKIKNKI